MTRQLLIVFALIGVAMGGCSSDSPKGPEADEVGTGTAESPGGGDVITPTSDAGPLSLSSFRSPSGNVVCDIYQDNSVRCDARDWDWDLPPRPGDCDFDWGGSLEIANGEARLLCHSDAVPAFDDVLAYGQTTVVGVISCTSERTGVNCRDTKTDSGFIIARGSYRLF